MREGWQISSLEEVVKFIDYRGKTPPKIEYGMRLITAKNVKMGYLQNEPMEFVDPRIYDQWMTRGIPKQGDVLFTTEAPLGNVAQLDTNEQVVFAQRIIVMQPKREVLDSTFLKYMLLSNLMQEKIHEKGTGATVKGIKSQLLKKVQISFPRSLSEQKRIVAILDEAFEGIDRAISNTEKNLSNARELFESYLNSIFSQKGEGWEVKSLDEIATIKGGKRVPKGYKFETTPTLHPYITVADFTEDGTVCTKNLKYISDEVYEQIKNYTISSQDIYISIAGTIGKTGSVPKSLDGANLTENACKLLLHQGIEHKFVYYLTKTDGFIQQTGINTRVAAQPKLALVRLKTIKLPLPPLTEQKNIVKKLDEISTKTQRLENIYRQKIAALKELKQSILQKAFTGELTADNPKTEKGEVAA